MAAICGKPQLREFRTPELQSRNGGPPRNATQAGIAAHCAKNAFAQAAKTESETDSMPLGTKQGKGKGRSGKKQAGLASGAGFGAKAPNGRSQAVDSLNSLRRSEELYLRILKEHYKDIATNGAAHDYTGESPEQDPLVREYVICVRASHEGKSVFVKEASGGRLLPDWLPVAELLLVSHEEASEVLPAALPFVCREVAECAGLVLGASFPRHVLEFAFESAESFYDEVATAALGFGNLTSENEGAVCPYTTLGVPKGAPLYQIRAAYRTLAAQHHPDRHEDHKKEAAEESFKAVTEAYDRIRSSGGGAVEGSLSGSFVALGGPKRQGLSPPLRVRPSKSDERFPPNIRVAVRPLELELVEVFLARISRRASAREAVA